MDCFGITKDISSNYMFVTKYFEDGDYLYSCIDEVNGILDWKNIVEILWGISNISMKANHFMETFMEVTCSLKMEVHVSLMN